MRTGILMSMMLGATISAIGCRSDGLGVPHPDRSLYKLKMVQPAVVLAPIPPYNTVQLTAVAYRGNGEVIPDATPTFVASDETLTVTPDGLVTALAVTINSYVVARVQYDGVTRIDTTWISILSPTNLSPLSTFSIQVDSVVPAGSTVSIRVTARDERNVNLASRIPVSFAISDQLAASVSRNRTIIGRTVNRWATVYATSVVLGVRKTDSARVRIDYPMAVYVYLIQRLTSSGDTTLVFEPNVINIRRGGEVFFCNCGVTLYTSPLGIVFNPPEAAHQGPSTAYPPGSGNIEPFIGTNWLDMYRGRSFPDPGTYGFRGNPVGNTGTIIVR